MHPSSAAPPAGQARTAGRWGCGSAWRRTPRLAAAGWRDAAHRRSCWLHAGSMLAACRQAHVAVALRVAGQLAAAEGEQPRPAGAGVVARVAGPAGSRRHGATAVGGLQACASNSKWGGGRTAAGRRPSLRHHHLHKLATEAATPLRSNLELALDRGCRVGAEWGGLVPAGADGW